MLKAARAEMHVKEAKNRNDHPRIHAYFKSVGQKSEKRAWQYNMWCGAFVGYVFIQCGVNVMKLVGNPAATVDWLVDKRLRLPPGESPAPADLCLYKYNRKGKNKVDHIGLSTDWPPNPRFPYFTALDGNTSAPKSAASNRQGVWEKARLKTDVKFKIDLISLYQKLYGQSTKG